MTTARIVYKPSGQTWDYVDPRKAALRVAAFKMRYGAKSAKENLEVTTSNKLPISIYAPEVPDAVVNLIERIESDFAVLERTPICPELHWIPKYDELFTSGRTWTDRTTHKVTHITITAGTDHDYLLGTVIHEMAHAMQPFYEHHSTKFYELCFKLYRAYLSPQAALKNSEREWTYKKTSKWVYMHLFHQDYFDTRQERDSVAAMNQIFDEGR